jgi:hypothetical protein
MTTLTKVFPCFFLSCKANARVKPAKTGHGPHSSLFLCCSMYFLCSVYFCVLCIVCFVTFPVLHVCIEQLPPGGYPIAVKYIISYICNVLHVTPLSKYHMVHLSVMSQIMQFCILPFRNMLNKQQTSEEFWFCITCFVNKVLLINHGKGYWLVDSSEQLVCCQKHLLCTFVIADWKGVRCFQGLKIGLMINASAQARSRGIDRFTYSKSAEQRLQMHGRDLSLFVHQHITSLLTIEFSNVGDRAK